MSNRPILKRENFLHIREYVEYQMKMHIGSYTIRPGIEQDTIVMMYLDGYITYTIKINDYYQWVRKMKLKKIHDKTKTPQIQ